MDRDHTHSTVTWSPKRGTCPCLVTHHSGRLCSSCPSSSPPSREWHPSRCRSVRVWCHVYRHGCRHVTRWRHVMRSSSRWQHWHSILAICHVHTVLRKKTRIITHTSQHTHTAFHSLSAPRSLVSGMWEAPSPAGSIVLVFLAEREPFAPLLCAL